MAENSIHTAGFSWLWKMAWRDARASFGKLGLFMASIVLGIAAVVSIHSFGENLKDNIALQSKSLMGADYIIDSDQPITEKVSHIIDSLGGADASETSFSSMILFPSNGKTKLMDLRGISGGFPFYGKIETTQNDPVDFQQQNAALVDATTMLQFGLKPGDSIKFGNVTLPILGRLKSIPGSSSIFSSIAPPVLVPEDAVKSSGLIQTGSRIDYNYYFQARAGQDMKELDEKLDPVLDIENADIDTHTATSERLGRRYENFGKFLNLVAFIALLMGCIGIASSIHLYIKSKLRSVAVLKCLGVSRKQSFLIFLIQIALIGLLGGVAGTTLGVLLQQLFPAIIGNLLPFEVEITLVPEAILMGISLGFFLSLLFALQSLVGTLYVSPLEALRVINDRKNASLRARLAILLAIFVFIYLFSYFLLGDWKFAGYFVLSLLVIFGILTGTSQLFIGSVKRFFPKKASFIARQSLLNLFRPNNQTLMLVLSIGLGTFLISTLYFSRGILLKEASLDAQANSPNLILLDVQTEQAKNVSETITAEGLPVLNEIPIVTMRVAELNGKTTQELKNDSTSTINRWILNHEFRTTYRDSIIASEEIVEGRWISSFDGEGPIPVSASEDFAKDAEVSLGDTVIFNVQGVLMPTRISSLRKVDWGRVQLNFSLVFPAGALEQAPQFKVFTTKAANESQSASLQQQIVKNFPNISILDLRQILSLVEDILGKIAWLVNFMAFFCIATGIIVLIGAVRTSKYQRIKESVLLRTLGAQSGQILKIVSLEYIYLGLLGSLAGILLALVAGFLMAYFLFQSVFIPSLIPFVVIVPAICALVWLIGIFNSLEVIKSPPLQVLRKQN